MAVTQPRDHGPLPILLTGLTVVSGLVDAFSYLVLGRLFVANMTGNVVFLGFSVASIGDISWPAVLWSLTAFSIGAACGGRWAKRRAPHRGRLLTEATAFQTGFVLVSAILASFTIDAYSKYVLIGLLAVSMGGQNAIVARLAVPDLTTTVLTRTITGLLAEATPWSVRRRRIQSILALLLGAAVGGALLHVSRPLPLWFATAALAACATIAHLLTCRPTSDSWR